MLSEKKKNRCAADSDSSSYSVFRTAKQILPMQRQSRHFLPRITASVLQMGTVTVPQSPKPLPVHSYHLAAQGKPQSRPARQAVIVNLRQHRIIPALRLKHRSGGCGTASALPKCSIRLQYYLRFWLSICRTSLAVSALRIMRYCPNKRSLQSSKVNLQRALVCIKAENCIISRHVFKVRIIGQAMIYNRSIEGNGSLPK